MERNDEIDIKTSMLEHNAIIHERAERNVINAIRKLPASPVKNEIIKAAAIYSRQTTRRLAKSEWEIMQAAHKLSFYRKGAKFIKTIARVSKYDLDEMTLIEAAINAYFNI